MWLMLLMHASVTGSFFIIGPPASAGVDEVLAYSGATLLVMWAAVAGMVAAASLKGARL